MQTVVQINFPTVKTEGAILPAELLQQIADQANLPGLRAEDYHLFAGEKLNEAINRAWTRCLGAWQRFVEQQGRLSANDFGTTLTRERWLLILFQELGYGRLQSAPTFQIEETPYPISHVWGHMPIHLVSFRQDIDRTMAGGRGGMGKRQPHSLVQEFLNRSPDHLWGMVSNGLRLRLLRDNISLSRMAYLEFDLEAMFTGELYADFSLLWLVAHQSRLEVAEGQTPADCWLEQWSKMALDQGARVLDALRDGVQEAIEALGRGFLAHKANRNTLHQALRTGELSTQEYYRQLLRSVYRLIFLFAAEERNLLQLPHTSPEMQQFYTKYYSASRLRRLAEFTRGGPHADLYIGLGQLLTLLRQGYAPLGISPLGGFLFSPRATPHLDNAQIANQDLLTAVRALTFVIEGQVRRLVDYRNLGAEELGSVYESLLELHPDLDVSAATFSLNFAAGSERKTSGSYYTPTSLINALLDSALEPVVAERLKNASQEAALLSIKLVDPACGSGHFLIAAAHRLARHLAIIRSGNEEPTPQAQRAAMSEVVANCIYGVDLNEMAVELCKVALWMETLTPGQPLSFLDHHIKHGNSLIGATPELLAEGIPDDAFQPVTGDDNKVATTIRKRNKAERGGQMKIWQVTTFLKTVEDVEQWRALNHLAQTDPLMAEQTYQKYRTTPTYCQQKLAYDLWTAAFFWPLMVDTPDIPTHHVFLQAQADSKLLPATTVDQTERLAAQHEFFHWSLEFPHVFEATGDTEGQVIPSAAKNPPPQPQQKGGFDVVLGNPPWGRVKLQEKEFFATPDPDIANASNATTRRKLIKALPKDNPTLDQTFKQAVRASEATSHFLRNSNRYPLTGVGDVNTYAVFSELVKNILDSKGFAGIIVQSGIGTDYTYRNFFAELVKSKQIVSFFDFENREGLFPSMHRTHPHFCLLTITGRGIQASQMELAFWCTNATHLEDKERKFYLSAEDFKLLNPNTLTCPIFRTRYDAELTRKLYRAAPVLINEQTKENPWGVSFATMFHMANDSHLFRTQAELEVDKSYLPLYEAKLFHQFDHRFGSYATTTNRTSTNLETPTLAQHQDPAYRVQPWYWVEESEVKQHINVKNKWFLAYRNITNTTNERTSIFTLIPLAGVGHSASMLLLKQVISLKICGFIINLSTFAFDFIVRQKVGGTNFSFFIVNQLPVIPPDRYTPDLLAYIVPRVLELTYTAWDLRPFADDVWREAGEGELQQVILAQWEANRLATNGGHANATPPAWAEHQAVGSGAVEGDEQLPTFHAPPPSHVPFPHPPFMWDEERRAQLRADLDGLYGHLYGLTREELAYILETFPIVKRRDEATYGEYRTKRLVLEAYDSWGEK